MYHQVCEQPEPSRRTQLLMNGSGVGSRMWIVILGRAISGMGGAGTMTISAVIITGMALCSGWKETSLIPPDIVPKREIATWRAYVNISMTLGRSIGGPVGGWLSDTIGWRWYERPFPAKFRRLISDANFLIGYSSCKLHSWPLQRFW